MQGGRRRGCKCEYKITLQRASCGLSFILSGLQIIEVRTYKQ
jgi:hypothetical protein